MKVTISCSLRIGPYFLHVSSSLALSASTYSDSISEINASEILPYQNASAAKLIMLRANHGWMGSMDGGAFSMDVRFTHG